MQSQGKNKITTIAYALRFSDNSCVSFTNLRNEKLREIVNYKIGIEKGIEKLVGWQRFHETKHR